MADETTSSIFFSDGLHSTRRKRRPEPRMLRVATMEICSCKTKLRFLLKNVDWRIPWYTMVMIYVSRSNKKDSQNWFNVKTLKPICENFELSFKSKDTNKISDMAKECSCWRLRSYDWEVTNPVAQNFTVDVAFAEGCSDDFRGHFQSFKSFKSRWGWLRHCCKHESENLKYDNLSQSLREQVTCMLCLPVVVMRCRTLKTVLPRLFFSIGPFFIVRKLRLWALLRGITNLIKTIIFHLVLLTIRDTK